VLPFFTLTTPFLMSKVIWVVYWYCVSN
jgi:hypothetical protein